MRITIKLQTGVPICIIACGSYILKLANQQIMSDTHLHLSSYYSITKHDQIQFIH